MTEIESSPGTTHPMTEVTLALRVLDKRGPRTIKGIGRYNNNNNSTNQSITTTGLTLILALVMGGGTIYIRVLQGDLIIEIIARFGNLLNFKVAEQTNVIGTNHMALIMILELTMEKTGKEVLIEIMTISFQITGWSKNEHRKLM